MGGGRVHVAALDFPYILMFETGNWNHRSGDKAPWTFASELGWCSRAHVTIANINI